MASSQEELGHAVAVPAKNGGASAAVAIGAMGEAQRVGDPVDGVEDERDVDGLDQSVLLRAGLAGRPRRFR